MSLYMNGKTLQMCTGVRLTDRRHNGTHCTSQGTQRPIDAKHRSFLVDATEFGHQRRHTRHYEGSCYKKRQKYKLLFNKPKKTQ